MATTFDPARIDADITLSNGNLTATHTSVTAENANAPGNGFHSTGKWSFRITMGTVTAAHTQAGMAASTTPTGIGQFLGADKTSFAIQTNGVCLINNASQGNIGITYTSSAVLDFAVDLINALVWVRVNSGNWNGNVANSPGGSGGQTLGVMTTFTLSPAVSVYTQNDSAVLNTTPGLGIAGFPDWDQVGGLALPLSVGKVHTIFNSTEVTLQMPGLSTSQAILTDGLPFGTVELSQASGTTISSVQVQQSNDNVTWINQGAAVSVPAIQDIYTGTSPSKFVRFLVNGGDTTSVVNIMLELLGTRD